MIDVSWKIAHGVLYMAQHLMSFGMPVPLLCFCGAPVESLEHLFFFLSFGSKCSFMASIFTVSFLPHVSMCPVLFGFKLDELHVTPCVFVYLLDLSKFLIWHSWNFLVLWYPSWHRHRSSCRLTCTQGSTSHYFSSALNPFAANATSIGNGKLAVLLPLLSMVVCL